MRQRVFLFLSVGFLLFLSQTFVQGLKNLEQYQLANGLTIILNEENSKPEVYSYVV